MRRVLMGITALGALGVTAAALAQDRGGPDGPFRGDRGPRGGMRAAMSEGDRDAFLDARIAGLHAGLKLNPDQEKLWPPVETALRTLVRQRREAGQARRERFMSMREGGEAPDIPAGIRAMADRQAASAEVLRGLADASGPLYASLDDGQKRRLRVLARFMQPGGRGMGWQGRGDRPMRRGDVERGDRFAGPGAGPRQGAETTEE